MRPVVCALVTGALLIIGGPASADRAILRDDTKDVHSPEGANSWTDEGSVVNTDARRTLVAHRARSVKVAVNYVKLQKQVSDEIDVVARLRTGSAEYEVHVSVDWLFRGAPHVSLVDLSDYSFVDCESASAHASLRQDRIAFVVPRACLGRPRWVKFLGTAESYAESDGLFIDNLMGATPQPGHWTRALRAG